MRYANTFTYVRTTRTIQRSTGPRERDAMRQQMAALSVEAYDLKIFKPQVRGVACDT